MDLSQYIVFETIVEINKISFGFEFVENYFCYRI